MSLTFLIPKEAGEVLGLETVPLLRTEGQGGGVTADRLLITPLVGAGPQQVCLSLTHCLFHGLPDTTKQEQTSAAAAETWARKRCATSLQSHSQ